MISPAQCLVALLEAADDIDLAAQSILMAPPHRMTEAADRLDKSRVAMRKAISDFRRSGWMP
jgi:hypothetical protein